MYKSTGTHPRISSPSRNQVIDEGDDYEVEDLDPIQNHPMKMFVISTDTIWKTRIDQTLTAGWTHKPPLFVSIFGKDRANDRHVLKLMCRAGIPSALKCAIWLTNVVRATTDQVIVNQNSRVKYNSNSNTTMTVRTVAEILDTGTLQNVRVLEHGWEVAMQSMFSNESDELAIVIPDFGLSQTQLDQVLLGYISIHPIPTKTPSPQKPHTGDGPGIPEAGRKAILRVLYAARRILDIDYCPFLPDLTSILLTRMPESYAFAILRSMRLKVHMYYPTSKVTYIAWCKTFCDVMHRLYPVAAKKLEITGVLHPMGNGLDPMFRRFFVPILRKEQVYRIMDIYTMEGYKSLFRLGSLLLCFCVTQMTESDFVSAAHFWEAFREFTHSDRFHFDIFVEQAYGFQGKSLRKKPSPFFPRKEYLSRLIQQNESWAENMLSHASDHDDTEHQLLITQSFNPLPYLEGNIPVVLAKPASIRLLLAEFLPVSYTTGTKLDLIYSSDVHGRSLQTLYRCCINVKNSIVLFQVLQTDAILGIFSTESWHNSAAKSYGDGECAFFRLQPDPICYQWSHTNVPPDGDVSPTKAKSTDVEYEALSEYFMYSNDDFIAIGANNSGMSGLRLSQDLSKGSSATAFGYNNEPLAGRDLPDFDVGLLEVYRLIL